MNDFAYLLGYFDAIEDYNGSGDYDMPDTLLGDSYQAGYADGWNAMQRDAESPSCA